MLLVTAERLCEANHGQIWRKEGDTFRYATSHMTTRPIRMRKTNRDQGWQGTLVGRVGLECRPVLIADAWNDPEYEDKEGARLAPGALDAGCAVAARWRIDQHSRWRVAFSAVHRSPGRTRRYADQASSRWRTRLLGSCASAPAIFGNRSMPDRDSDVLKVISCSTFVCNLPRHAGPDRPGFATPIRRWWSGVTAIRCGSPQVVSRQVRGTRRRVGRFNTADDPTVVRAVLEGRPVHIHDVAAVPGYPTLRSDPSKRGRHWAFRCHAKAR